MPNRACHWVVRCAALLGALLSFTGAHAGSVRFFGAGVNDIDRIKIRIDPPLVPADVGATDFTIEFWLRALPGSNSNGVLSCAQDANNWINGNIVFDRDRYNQNRAFGISLGAGQVMFGTYTSAYRTICSTGELRDGLWHHVAVQRRIADGQLTLYVDGQPATAVDAPNNEDLSYPDNATPLNLCGSNRQQSCANSDPFIVLGAEKHDAGTQFPSFSGWLDELRISTTLRYTAAFTPSQQPFTVDAVTAALYHFDETSGTTVIDADSNGSPGALQAGAQWSSETPFGAAPTAGTLQLAAATYTAAENAASINLGVTRVGGSAGAVSVNAATVGGSASAGSDYTTTISTLNWADGDAATQSIVVPLVDDAVFEGSETFDVTLSNVTGGATLGTRSSATVTITDNEAPAVPGVLEFTSATFSAAEGAGTATITVRRSGGSDGDVGVGYATTDGTAQSGVDYQATSGTLAWANGDAASKTFAIAVTNDVLVESAETVTVTLAAPVGGASLGAPTVAQLSIVDDDVAGGGSGGGGGGGGAFDFAAIAGLWLILLVRRGRTRWAAPLFRAQTTVCVLQSS